MSRVKPCAACGAIVPDIGRSRCARCEAEYCDLRAAERSKSRDGHAEYVRRKEREDPAMAAFYRSKWWRMLSRQYEVDAGHVCEECGAVGTDVHHVVPIDTPEGWARRLDPSNLKLLCVRCHNRAHGRFGHA